MANPGVVPNRSIVLITGAGASTNLGLTEPLPMMAEWSSELRQRIEGMEAGLADAVGLRGDMTGEEFETALGRFIEWQKNLGLFWDFHGVGGNPINSTNSVVQDLFNYSTARSTRVVEAIHQSLYDNFNRQRIDLDAARSAYGQLLGFAAFGDSERDPVQLVCATTNYDPSLEAFLQGDGYEVHDGISRPPYETATLHPARVVAECRESGVDHVAVLHLHGAVGWYRTQTDTVEVHAADKAFNQSLGTPALLLPDPNKDPSSSAGVNDLWAELDDALENATHVLVLGHSLHDGHLVAHLRNHTFNATVGVAVLPSSTMEERQRIMNAIPEVRIFDLTFGPQVSDDVGALENWLRMIP